MSEKLAGRHLRMTIAIALSLPVKPRQRTQSQKSGLYTGMQGGELQGKKFRPTGKPICSPGLDQVLEPSFPPTTISPPSRRAGDICRATLRQRQRGAFITAFSLQSLCLQLKTIIL